MGEMAEYYAQAELEREARREHEKLMIARSKEAAHIQRARQDIKLLEQTDIWINKVGRKVPLTGMDLNYKMNIQSFLLKRAFAYQLLDIMIRGAGLQVIDESPESWISRKPLFVALIDRQGSRVVSPA